MNSETTSELKGSKTVVVNRPAKKSLRGVLLTTAFAVIAIGFIGSFLRDETRQRDAKRLSEDYTTELNQLTEARQQLERAKAQAKNDETIIRDALGQVRAVEDIPDFQSNHVVSFPNGPNLSGYLPPGKHDLIITAQWYPSRAMKPDPSVTTFKGERSWTVPIAGDSRFRFQINRDELFTRKGAEPVTWKLDCDQEDFKGRSETIPIGSFAGKSWSTSSNIQNIFVPNQVSDFYSLKTQETVAKSPIPLFQTKLHGDCNKIRHTIEFKVQVLSDGPACVSARAAAILIQQGKKDMLMPYQDSGVYQLRPQEENF